MKVFGTEDALGLRLRLQGVGTIVLPTIYDPTELRSEFKKIDTSGDGKISLNEFTVWWNGQDDAKDGFLKQMHADLKVDHRNDADQ